MWLICRASYWNIVLVRRYSEQESFNLEPRRSIQFSSAFYPRTRTSLASLHVLTAAFKTIEFRQPLVHTSVLPQLREAMRTQTGVYAQSMEPNHLITEKPPKRTPRSFLNFKLVSFRDGTGVKQCCSVRGLRHNSASKRATPRVAATSPTRRSDHSTMFSYHQQRISR
jgi:hypothetical protein